MNSRPHPALVSSLLALSIVGAQAADRSVPVTVINAANTPVPVLVTNAQGGAASIPKSVLSNVFGNTTANVMAAPGTGKRFLVRHVAMFMTSNSSGTLLSDANCLLALHQGSTSFTIALYALQHADVASSMGLSLDEYIALGPADSLEMTCVSNPGNSSGRVTVSGDLLSGQ